MCQQKIHLKRSFEKPSVGRDDPANGCTLVGLGRVSHNNLSVFSDEGILLLM